MRLYLIAGVCSVFLAGCAAPGSGCGLIGCVTSGHLKARLSPAFVGQPLSQAIATAGAPSSQAEAGGVAYLTWERSQQDSGLGQLSCRETISARNGIVTGYQRAGNC